MATKASRRVMESRKKSSDQISFLLPKGGRELIRLLALKYNTSISDLLRYAVMLLAGLEKMPTPDDLQGLRKAETQDEANDVLAVLQISCFSDDNVTHKAKLSPYTSEVFMDVSELIDDANKKRNKLIAKRGVDTPWFDHIEVGLTMEDFTEILYAMAENDPRLPHKEEYE